MNRGEIKVHVVGWGVGYASFLENYRIVDMKDADIVIFTGGEDINPELYKAKVHPTTYFTNRDVYEVEAYNEVLTHDNIKLIVGICRGAQLGCALNGGKIIQNVANHGCGNGHKMVVKDTGEIYRITSLHHQMMYPFDLPAEKYKIITSAYPARSPFYEGDLIDPIKVIEEPEIVLFNGEKPLLGIQGHPEMMDKRCDTVDFINGLIYEML